MKQLVRKVCGLFLAVAMVVTMIPEASMDVRAEDNVFTQQPSDAGIEEGSTETSKAVSWTTSFKMKKFVIFYEDGTQYSHNDSVNSKSFTAGVVPSTKRLYVRAWYGDGDSDYVDSNKFCVGNYIRDVRVAGFVKPEVGAKAIKTTDLYIPNNVNYSISNLTWYEFPEGAHNFDAKDPGTFLTYGDGDDLEFKALCYYRAVIQLNAKDSSTYMFDYRGSTAGITDDQFTHLSLNGGDSLISKTYSWVNGHDVGASSTFKLQTNTFELKQYTVNFDANNGTTETYGPQYVTEDENGEFLYALPTIETAGFTAPEGGTFTGWTVIKSDASELNVSAESIGTPAGTIQIDGDVTLKASWNIKYTLTFDANGGTGTMDPIVVTDGVALAGEDAPNEYTLPECGFTPPEGKRFVAWEVDGIATASPGVGIKIEVKSNRTIKPVWADVPKAIFDANGGTGTMADVVSEKVGDDYVVTLPECTFTAPEGASFFRWTYKNSSSQQYVRVAPGAKIPVTGNTSVKALWNKNLTITLSAGGGTGTMTATPVEYILGDDVPAQYELPVCTFTAPEGKVFDCWDISYENSSDETNNTPVTTPGLVKKITGNITLTALWVTDGWKVEYDPNGGTGVMAPSILNKGDKLSLPACTFTAPTGMEFDRWNIGETGAAGEEINVASNMTIMAMWKEQGKEKGEYWTISFVPGDGTGAMSKMIAEKGKTYNLILPVCQFTAPDGKIFDEWYFNDKVRGEEGDSVTVPSDVTYTAVWRDPISYTVTYLPGDGGTGTMPAETVKEGGIYTVPECSFTAPEGKEFDKWKVGYDKFFYAVPGDELPIDEIVMPDIDPNGIKVTATWKDKGDYWTVTFAPGVSGSGTMNPVTVTKGEKLKLPENKFEGLLGVTFDKWQIGSGEVYGNPGDEVTIEADTVVTAVWKALVPIHTGFDVVLSSESLPYTGYAVTPVVTVYDDYIILTEGVDYTLTWKNNVKVGTKASVTVKFTGNYAGKAVVKNFTITAADIDKAQKKAAEGIVGSVKTALTPVLYFGGAVLKENKDYELDWTDVDLNTAGDKTIKVKGKGSFAGSNTTVPLKLYDKSDNKISLTDKKVKIRIGTTTFLGTDPVPTVTYGSTPLTKDVDYEVHYWGMNYSNTAYVTVTGKGNYCGSKSASYKVNKDNLKTMDSDNKVKITVNNDNPVAFVKGGAKPSVKVEVYAYGFWAEQTEGISYKVAYSGNKALGGKASVKITGLGQLTGVATKNFTIVNKDISELEDNCFVGDIESTAAAADAYKKVKVAVFDTDGSELKEKTDYTLEWTAPVSGEATVTVKGTGKGYTGSFTKTYKVVDAGIGIQKAKISVLDANSKPIKMFIYKGTQIIPGQTEGTLKVATTGKGGKTLTLGEDYEIAGCVNNLNKGNGVLILKGKGTNCGLMTYKFKINAKTLKK